jgi:hypothetical protein
MAGEVGIALIQTCHAADPDRPKGVSLHHGLLSLWARLENPRRSGPGSVFVPPAAHRHSSSTPPFASSLRSSPPPAPTLFLQSVSHRATPPSTLSPPRLHSSSPACSIAMVVAGPPGFMSGLPKRPAFREFPANPAPTVWGAASHLPWVWWSGRSYAGCPGRCRSASAQKLCTKIAGARCLPSFPVPPMGAAGFFRSSTGCPTLPSCSDASESAVQGDGAATCCSRFSLVVGCATARRRSLLRQPNLRLLRNLLSHRRWGSLTLCTSLVIRPVRLEVMLCPLELLRRLLFFC